jgi:hypothetical protein
VLDVGLRGFGVLLFGIYLAYLAGHKMNEATRRFIDSLKQDIARWEETASFLANPYTAIEDIDGRVQDKAAIAARYRALAAEYRELLSRLTRA